MTGFEPATSSTQNTHATKLRHIPIFYLILKDVFRKINYLKTLVFLNS